MYVAALPWEVKSSKCVKTLPQVQLKQLKYYTMYYKKMKNLMAYVCVDINTITAVAYVSIICSYA